MMLLLSIASSAQSEVYNTFMMRWSYDSEESGTADMRAYFPENDTPTAWVSTDDTSWGVAEAWVLYKCGVYTNDEEDAVDGTLIVETAHGTHRSIATGQATNGGSSSGSSEARGEFSVNSGSHYSKLEAEGTTNGTTTSRAISYPCSGGTWGTFSPDDNEGDHMSYDVDYGGLFSGDGSLEVDIDSADWEYNSTIGAYIVYVYAYAEVRAFASASVASQEHSEAFSYASVEIYVDCEFEPDIIAKAWSLQHIFNELNKRFS